MLFQEPSATKTFNFVSHPAFQRIEPLQDPSRYATTRPRTIAYFRRSFPFDFSPRFDLCEDPDLQVFEIYTPEPFYLAHIYNEKRPPNSGYTTKTTEALRALRLEKPLIIIGDFNLHHPWWNPVAETSTEATALVEWLQHKKATYLVDPEALEAYGGIYFRFNL
jgi:retrotransposon-encoded endonuclease